jgi:hypothetical protein
MHVLTRDIDVSRSEDVKTLDGFVFTCVSSAKDALMSALPPGFSEFERDQLPLVVEGLRHGHLSIRKLLAGERSASAVDALAIARLQLETLYTFCFLLQSAENVRLFLKNSWKKKYIRFLLEREERRNLQRCDEFYTRTGLPFINMLQRLSSVSDEERQTIEQDEIGTQTGKQFTRVDIPQFPTPRGVIEKAKTASQKRMLERLYPEYQFLCSFAHGDPEATLFRTVSDPRSPFRNHVTSGQIEDFYQRQVLEAPISYSTLSAVQVASEVAAVYPSNVELLAKVTQAWAFLQEYNLLALTIWELRAKDVLPLI